MLLHKMGIEETSTCKRCHISEETIVHKFWDCPIVKQFWDNVNEWLISIGAKGAHDAFTDRQVLFGVRDPFISHVIIVVKYVIRKGSGLHMEHVKRILRRDKQCEELAVISGINNNERRNPLGKWQCARGESFEL